MKIKLFLIATITFLVFLFSLGNFSIKPNDVFAESTSVSNVQDGDYEYVHVFVNGEWWIYVYDGGILIAVYPEDD